MRIIIILLISSCSLMAQVPSEKSASNEARQTEELIALSNNFFRLVQQHDKNAVASLMADDFTLTSSESNGELANKEQYLFVIADSSLLKVSEFKFSDFKIRIYGDVAIVQSRLYWRSVYRGKPWNTTFMNTDIFNKKNSLWKIVLRHTSYPVNDLKRIVSERQN